MKKLIFFFTLSLSISIFFSSHSYAENYIIKFGLMKKNENGKYYVYEETKKIPLVAGSTGFRWGYTIKSDGNDFTSYAFDYASLPFKNISNKYKKENNQGNKLLYKKRSSQGGYYYRDIYNDPTDPLGEQRIEIFINDKLFTTIHFMMVAP